MKSIKKYSCLVIIALVLSLTTSAFAATKDLKLGLPNQQVEDILIKESQKGAFLPQKSITLTLPKGIRFSAVPLVEVINGDLQIDSVENADNSDGTEYIKIDIKEDSSKPSTISIKNINLTIDRTVPNGPVYLDMSGSAINETSDLFPKTSDSVYKIYLGNVIGPAANTSVVFNIGGQVYKVNETAKVMSTPPYIKDNRVFIPLRELANAMGIDDKNITFQDNKLTIVRGSKKIDLYIGLNQYAVNDKVYKLDVCPEIVNGHTMLPVRIVSEVLGGNVFFLDNEIKLEFLE